MKKLLVLFLLTGLGSILPQEVIRKQITFLSSADCKNFYAPQPNNNDGFFVFEADFGSKTNIFLGKYDMTADSFLVIRNLTDNEFRNVKPSLIYLDYSDTVAILYQTNENGNWDIACKILLGDSLSETKFLTTSSVDEYNPQFMRYQQYYDYAPRYISFQSALSTGNGVSIKQIDSSDPPVEIYHPSAGNNYKYPFFNYYHSTNLTLAVFATKDSSDGNHYVVSRKLEGGIWSNTNLSFKADANNTTYCALGDQFYGSVTFDAVDSTTGKRNIFYIDPFVPGLSINKLFDAPAYDYSEFQTAFETLFACDNMPYRPYCYKASRNDSLFIGASKYLMPKLYHGDTLIYTKVSNSSLGIGKVGFMYRSLETFYSVWQDSIDGHIQLFGIKNIQPVSSVEKEDQVPSSFILNQNYPNPFNPSTTINYTLGKNSHVKLSIYSLLGEVISIPVNEHQQSGSYTVNFNAVNLPSGVYFYELSSEGNRSVKKMCLIK